MVRAIQSSSYSKDLSWYGSWRLYLRGRGRTNRQLLSVIQKKRGSIGNKKHIMDVSRIVLILRDTHRSIERLRPSWTALQSQDATFLSDLFALQKNIWSSEYMLSVDRRQDGEHSVQSMGKYCVLSDFPLQGPGKCMTAPLCAR